MAEPHVIYPGLFTRTVESPRELTADEVLVCEMGTARCECGGQLWFTAGGIPACVDCRMVRETTRYTQVSE